MKYIIIVLFILGLITSSGSAKEKKGTLRRPFYTFNELAEFCSLGQEVPLGQVAMDKDAWLASIPRVKLDNFHGPRFKEFAFTFDMGAKPGTLHYILQTLHKYNVKAAFFVTGSFIKSFPDEVRAIVHGGHEVGNHTYHHPKMSSPSQLARELLSTEKIFFEVTGKRMAPYWRSPYLQTRFRRWQLKEAQKLGYMHFMATIDANDWAPERSRYFITGPEFVRRFEAVRLVRDAKGMAYPQYLTSERSKFLRRSGNFESEGAILLMHTDSMRKRNQHALELEKLILFLHRNGYSIVSLSEVMNERASFSEPFTQKF
jgi:peptidoglycan/xylan/chitin deacetylase (PgdA/CDA1 family)